MRERDSGMNHTQGALLRFRTGGEPYLKLRGARIGDQDEVLLRAAP